MIVVASISFCDPNPASGTFHPLCHILSSLKSYLRSACNVIVIQDPDCRVRSSNRLSPARVRPHQIDSQHHIGSRILGRKREYYSLPEVFFQGPQRPSISTVRTTFCRYSREICAFPYRLGSPEDPIYHTSVASSTSEKLHLILLFLNGRQNSNYGGLLGWKENRLITSV